MSKKTNTEPSEPTGPDKPDFQKQVEMFAYTVRTLIGSGAMASSSELLAAVTKLESCAVSNESELRREYELLEAMVARMLSGSREEP